MLNGSELDLYGQQQSMNDRLTDGITKQKLNVILMVDVSTSMNGTRINQVNDAIEDVLGYLRSLQDENANVDFYMSILTFGTDAKWLDDKKCTNVSEYVFNRIKARGQSNLHLAYEKLDEVLDKEKNGGIMPDFGGIAPIILLLTDGHPSKGCKKQLDLLKKKPWFNVALKYGISVELNDERTKKVLRDFVGNTGEVIDCYDARLLKRIIQIIVITASKVKSKTSSVTINKNGKKSLVETQEVVRQEIQTKLIEVDDWEW